MNVAFVGCGFVFDIYMRTIRAYPELIVKGVYDIKPGRSRRVGDYYGFHVYSTFDELLSDDAVDIVVNLTNIGRTSKSRTGFCLLESMLIAKNL